MMNCDPTNPPAIAMNFPPYLNSTLNWLTGPLAWLTDTPPAYIAAAAVVPIVVALLARNLLAILWTILFALGTISLCATEAGPWAALATFEVTASFLLVFSLIIWARRNRIARDELEDLKRRVNQLEAADDRKFMASLRNPTAPRNSPEVVAGKAPP
jgi:hypothetical protein